MLKASRRGRSSWDGSKSAGAGTGAVGLLLLRLVFDDWLALTKRALEDGFKIVSSRPFFLKKKGFGVNTFKCPNKIILLA